MKTDYGVIENKRYTHIMKLTCDFWPEQDGIQSFVDSWCNLLKCGWDTRHVYPHVDANDEMVTLVVVMEKCSTDTMIDYGSSPMPGWVGRELGSGNG